MKTRPPTSEEIEELLSFLPRLHAEGFDTEEGADPKLFIGCLGTDKKYIHGNNAFQLFI